KNLKAYYADKKGTKFTGKPDTPKAKKLSKVFNYSVPLEVSKFSLKKKNRLGINIWKKMEYVFFRENDYLKDKTINNVTVALSHGHIYYQLSYQNKKNDKAEQKNNAVLPVCKPEKTAGLDIGVHHLFSLFVNDSSTESLVYRNAKMIHYNCAFNKQMARLNTLLTKHVAEYKTVSKQDGTVVTVPERYTSYGQHIKKTISNMFNSRNLFMEGEMNKLSSALLQYLKKHEVTQLVLSKNLSFAKTEGTVELRKKTKQNFYQIPFGKFLNLIEEKAFHYGISITNIDEAYTSKTSSLTADVNQVKQMAANKEPITSNELNGVRGVKNQKLTRGLFKDKVLNTIIHADINAAVNHIKVGFPGCISTESLLKCRKKLNNPVKIKSANEFSFLMKENSDSRRKEVDTKSVQPALYVHDQV
ncbi:TPA: transposase, partial [Escherichia coli]|nr:transposase [Escherichia coli]